MIFASTGNTNFEATLERAKSEELIELHVNLLWNVLKNHVDRDKYFI